MPTKIEWAEEVWNPVTGCTKISPGCAHCYAERMSKRLAGRFGYPQDEPFRVTLHEDKLSEPLRWKKPRMVFVCSMGDLFHEDVPESFIDMIFTVIDACERHTFLILTKRPQCIQEYFTKNKPFPSPPPTNIWLGVSVENQQTAIERIPILLRLPTKVRFVSVEPMLESIDLTNYLSRTIWHTHLLEYRIAPPLDWVICGGESGPGRRPMKLEWARVLRDQCREAGVSFFFKQVDKIQPIPKDLMIREFPDA